MTRASTDRGTPPGRGSGWTRPEVILGILGLIVAIVGVLVTVFPLGGKGNDGADDPPSTSQAAPPSPVPSSIPTTEPGVPLPQSTEPTGPTPPSSAPAAPQPSLLWSGRKLMPRQSGLELDSAPASTVNVASPTSDLSFDNREALGMKLYAGAALAVPQTSGPPGPRDCAEALQTFPIADSEGQPGETLCVGTGEGRVARVTVKGLDSGTYGLIIEVEVWE